MQWQGISEFVHVAENESFTKTAKIMALSTAQVSRQINALEERLNVKLFYRTTRKVSLTDEGRIFYQHCRKVLDGLDDAERTVTNLQSKPQGKVRMTAPITYGEEYVLPLVNDFMVLHSDIEVYAYLSNHQVDLVEEGYDLAVRLGKLADSSMMAKKLVERTHCICASPAYLEKYGTPRSPAELKKHSCLLGTLDSWHYKDNGKEKSIRVTGRLRYNSGHSLADAAVKGLGIVQLPTFYVQHHLQSGALLTLLDNYREPDKVTWAVYPQNRHLSPKIRLLVDYLAEHLV